MSMTEEILKRRTFAIVSHPDAGKTTITEKFLWFGKVIREAHVRYAKAYRPAHPDAPPPFGQPTIGGQQ